MLLRIHRELDGSFALDCEVVQPGTFRVGDRRRASVTLPMAAADAMTIVNADASRHSRAIPGELRSQEASGSATGTRVAYADPALAPIVERFCVEVVRRTGIWCAPERATRKLPAGVPLIRVELACDAELDELPAADGVSPAAEGASDERHVLWIEGDRIVVRGVEPVGAARGLTTLVQLLATATPEDDDGTIVLPAAHIVDAPRFAWRSLSFDLARRFFTVSEVKRVIDLIALYKLNVLHLHVTDDHTNAELRELIAYARARFVTLVSETSPAPTSAPAADAAPVVVSPVDHAYFDVPDAEAWSDPRAGSWSDHRDRLTAHRRLWEQDELTYFISSAEAGVACGRRRPIINSGGRGEPIMTSEGVATGADELKQKLAQHIDAARSKLEMLKKDVVGLHEDDMDMLRKKRDELRARIDRQKDRLQQAHDDIARWKAEKIAHTQDAITSWRQRRELEKLEHRAERAEDYALRMVSLAAMDFEEAEQAILDAMAARYDAELASSSGGA